MLVDVIGQYADAFVTVENFAQGRVQMREMVVRHDSAAAGKRIRDLFPPDRHEGALAVSLTRDGCDAVGNDDEDPRAVSRD